MMLARAETGGFASGRVVGWADGMRIKRRLGLLWWLVAAGKKVMLAGGRKDGEKALVFGCSPLCCGTFGWQVGGWAFLRREGWDGARMG